jgi:hypothetical protein
MAWPGDTTTVQLRPLNFGSLEEHIAKQKPTVAIVCYGSNEAFEGLSGLDSFLDGYRKILDTLQTTCRQVVLVSPNRHENLGPPLPDPTGHNRNLEAYTAAIAKLADERGHLFVDLFHKLGGSTDGTAASRLTENGIHLNELGYWQAATVLADAVAPRAAKAMTIDARSGKSSSGDAEVSGVSSSPTGVRFVATGAQVVVPTPESDSPTAGIEMPGPLLRVTGLKPGRYRLAVDGNKIVSATADEWSR